jgi:hypothetical protein
VLQIGSGFCLAHSAMHKNAHTGRTKMICPPDLHLGATLHVVLQYHKLSLSLAKTTKTSFVVSNSFWFILGWLLFFLLGIMENGSNDMNK